MVCCGWVLFIMVVMILCGDLLCLGLVCCLALVVTVNNVVDFVSLVMKCWFACLVVAECLLF